MTDLGQPESKNDSRPETAQQWKMDMLVGSILFVGVMLSLSLVAAGLFWKWARTGTLTFFHFGTGADLLRLARSGANLERFTPGSLVSAGIDVLVLTPYLGVLASALYFSLALKNWKYGLFSCVVLAVLTYSLFIHPARIR